MHFARFRSRFHRKQRSSVPLQYFLHRRETSRGFPSAEANATRKLSSHGCIILAFRVIAPRKKRRRRGRASSEKLEEKRSDTLHSTFARHGAVSSSVVGRLLRVPSVLLPRVFPELWTSLEKRRAVHGDAGSNAICLKNDVPRPRLLVARESCKYNKIVDVLLATFNKNSCFKIARWEAPGVMIIPRVVSEVL